MIRVEGLCKTYRVRKRAGGMRNAARALFSREVTLVPALREVSFTIPDGQTVGLIGPNGAGKSTLVKVLCGILTPERGVCLVNGLTPYRQRVRNARRIGVVFGQRSQLWWDVPVIDSFEMARDIYRVPEQNYQKTLREVTELFSLGDILRAPARSLSLGQRMRCELAASLLHEPTTLFLDEPTLGLDATSKLAMRRHINTISGERGVTVLITTHDMQDIEALAGRVMLIGQGRLLFDGALDDLKARVSTRKTITLRFSGDEPALIPGLELIERREGGLTLSLDPDTCSVPRAVAHLSAACELQDVSVAGLSAEAMAAALYEAYHL